MQTDIPLKELTSIYAADLLPLLGSAGATVRRVDSVELPAIATRLDSLLRLRSPLGTHYSHLVEWQGYRDPRFLRRTFFYEAWLTLHEDEPLQVTVVYLTPADDTGDTLQISLDGLELRSVRFRCVRLWEQDAAAAVARGRAGLATLSPLMAGASSALLDAPDQAQAEQAIRQAALQG